MRGGQLPPVFLPIRERVGYGYMKATYLQPIDTFITLILCGGIVLHQDDSVRELGDLSALNDKMSSPSKHDVISCLAVAGRWITSLQDLQVSSYKVISLVMIEIWYEYKNNNYY